MGTPLLRTIVSSLGELFNFSNYFTSDDKTCGCFLITFGHQVCLRSIPRLNRTFSGGQLLLKAVTVDLGHRTCPVKHYQLCRVVCCIQLFFYIYSPPPFSYPSLFFVKPLNFFTKSGCFGSEGLWRSNFLVQPFSLLRFNIERNTHSPQ